MKTLRFCLGLALIGGCSGRQGPSDRSFKGEVRNVPSGERGGDEREPKIRLAVVSPKADDRFKITESFVCRVVMSLPPDAVKPTFLYGQIVKDGKEEEPFDTQFLEVRKQAGGEFELETKLEAPLYPGNYSVRAKATFVTIKRDKEENPVGQEERQVYSPKVRFEATQNAPRTQ